MYNNYAATENCNKNTIFKMELVNPFQFVLFKNS